MAAIIKVRLNDGTLYKIPEASFVEICDEKGILAGILHMDPISGSVKLHTSGDLEFNRYCQSFKKKPAKAARP